MKFRTDFVTNSSDSSFLVFNIQNKKLIDFLGSLGIKTGGTKDGELSHAMRVTLPSGEWTGFDGFNTWTYPYASDFTSISAWFIGMLLYEIEVFPPYDGYEYSDFAKELIEILNSADITNLDWEMVENWSRVDLAEQLSKLNEYDEGIETAELEHAYGFEGEIGPCEKIRVSDGKKTTTYFSYSPWDDEDEEEDKDDEKARITGNDLWEGLNNLDLFDLAEKKGITSTETEIWKNGRWVRAYSEEEQNEQMRKAEEVKALTKKVISENVALRKLLIVNGQGRSVEDGDAEQLALAETISYEEMVDRGYICFEANVLPSKIEELKCLLTVVEEDNTIHFSVICEHDNWMLDGYAQRPLEIACIIANALSGIPHSGPKGELRFAGANICPLVATATLCAVRMTSSKPMFDFLEPKDISKPLLDYKAEYKFVLEKFFESPEIKSLFSHSMPDNYTDMQVPDLISCGALSLSCDAVIPSGSDLAAKMVFSINFNEIVVKNCYVVGMISHRCLGDGSDRLDLLAEHVASVLTSVEGTSCDTNEGQLNEELVAKIVVGKTTL